MRSVLGIDAAWTNTKPSGVALALETETGWHLRAVASSYERFHAMAGNSTDAEARGSKFIPDAGRLLASSRMLCGRDVSLIAIDMPLSRTKIAGRRVSDNAVSKEYGSRKCSTHSPSNSRPGPLSDELTSSFAACGYPLRTERMGVPGLIEVYPHPALVELSGAKERLPYKSAKVRRYWPADSARERRTRLLCEWSGIIMRLDAEIAGVAEAMPMLAAGESGTEIKGYEDMLDAVICAWVAIRALNGQALPFGDNDSAIWIPLPNASLSVPHTAEPAAPLGPPASDPERV